VKLRYSIVTMLVVAASAAAAFAGPAGTRTELISRASDGVKASGGSSLNPFTSPDGRFVAFESSATNLPGAGPDPQVYLRDRQTAETILISKTSDGLPATGGGSHSPSISVDGRFVAFDSYATNLPGSIGPSYSQVYLHDRQTGTTELVSQSTGGAQAQRGFSDDASISGDGRFVLFESKARNLPGALPGGQDQVYLRDLATNTTRLVSRTTDGVPANADSEDPSISTDGRFLGFESEATNLPGGLGVADQVYVRNRQANETILVSQNAAGSPADANSEDLSVSADGRFVGFESAATNLVGAGPWRQVYLRDRELGKTILISKANGGKPASGGRSEDASVSGDGLSVAFESRATNLGGAARDIDQAYVRDREHGRTHLVSVANNGTPANRSSFIPRNGGALTAKGHFVLFESLASNLPGSIPTYFQVYMRGRLP
jgi:Tol biopolymer transport system component